MKIRLPTPLKIGSLIVPFVLAIIGLLYFYNTESTKLKSEITSAHAKETTTNSQLTNVKSQLAKTAQDLEQLQKEDQYVKNATLEKHIKSIEVTYNDAVDVYELLVKLREQTNKTADYDTSFATILAMLSKRNYASAEAALTQLKSNIEKKQSEIAASFSIPQNVPVNNSAPTNGYRRQTVETSAGSFLVDIIAADLNTAKVVVDTASDSDCKTECPVSALGDYAARSGAFAAINGPYFCPATYPSCADKKNAYDTLLMNKNKHYFNSDNNVYSTVPAVIFSGNSARYVRQSLEWGRDTGVDSVIANQPLLVLDGNVVFGGDDEIKRSSRGSRSFIGSTGSTAYMGVVYNANVAEVAVVLNTMGIKNALNLDSGGSTALWNNGRYLVGPGRNLPFGILFVRK